MRKAFGIITKDFLTLDPLDAFLENAEKYGHDIDSVVITYSRNVDRKVLKDLEKLVKVHLVKINEFGELCNTLKKMRIKEESMKKLIGCEEISENGMIPYGVNRNATIMKAMIEGIDILFFVDTDVYPVCLIKKNGKIIKKEIDFIGKHMEFLRREDIYATTSDYSGYYIIPPMKFEGMKDLFTGLQKETAYKFISESSKNHCLNLANYENRRPFETTKLLGGNLALKLKVFKKIVPFFSTSYEFDGETYLTRGEDTLMGIEFSKLSNYKCIDIDLKIFHNTYGNYPVVPNPLEDKKIRDRFFYACMGWLGRNPFLNWIKEKDVVSKRLKQKKAMDIGALAASNYFNDDRFLMLPEVLEMSYDRLDVVVDEYKELVITWKEFITKLDDWRDKCEDINN